MSASVTAPTHRPLWARVLASRQFSEAGAVVLALAVAGGAQLARPVPPLLAVVVVLSGFAGRRAWLVALGLALLASALAAAAWAGAAPVPPGSVDAPATLLSDPEPVPGGVRAVVRVPDGLHLEVTARGRVAAGLRPRLAGEVVHVVGPRAPRADAADWLRQRHVVGTVDATEVRLVSTGTVPARAANGLRRLLTDGAVVLPPEQQALFTGLVFGDDRAEAPSVIDDFRASGLTHLLAVSGENVAFVLVAAGPVLRRLGPRARGVAAGAVLVFFAFATRFEPSVLRATAMALVATATTTFGAPISARRTLALAVTALLLIDPFLVGSVGFQLSVAASAGIIVLARPIERRLPGPRPFAELLGVTLAAQIGVAPVLIPVFGGLPLVSLPANLLAVPAAGPVMVWGLTGGILAGAVGAPLALVVHAPTRLLLGWIAGVARVAAAAPVGALDARTAVVLASLAGVIGTTRWLAARRGATVSHAVGRSVTAVTVAAATAMAVVVALAAFGRPRPVAPRVELGAGATLHVAGQGSAVLVLDGRARLDRVLDGLRRAGTRHLLLVVQRTRSGRLDADVALLRSRVDVDQVLRPVDQGDVSAGGPDVVPPAPGDQLVAGDLVVSVDDVDPNLRVSVAPRADPSDEQGRAPDPVRARAPPARTAV